MNIVEEIGKINAVGFSNIVNTFDPELITLGGSVALNNPRLVLNPILKGIDQYIINRKPEIIITPLEGDAVLTGALALSLCAHLKPNES
jgi:glucokinase